MINDLMKQAVIEIENESTRNLLIKCSVEMASLRQELETTKRRLEESLRVINLSKQTLHLSRSSVGHEEYCDSLNRFLNKLKNERGGVMSRQHKTILKCDVCEKTEEIFTTEKGWARFGIKPYNVAYHSWEDYFDVCPECLPFKKCDKSGFPIQDNNKRFNLIKWLFGNPQLNIRNEYE